MLPHSTMRRVATAFRVGSRVRPTDRLYRLAGSDADILLYRLAGSDADTPSPLTNVEFCPMSIHGHCAVPQLSGMLA